MRKVSSEAASISCIYFQQKISKNQEIRNWITVLQYQKKKKTPKSLLGHVYTYINSTTVRQAHKVKPEAVLIYFKYYDSPIRVQIPWQGREISCYFGINMETHHTQFFIIYLRETVNQLLISLLPFLKPISRLVANVY